MPEQRIEKLYAPMLVVFLVGAAFGAMADRLYGTRAPSSPPAATIAAPESGRFTAVIMAVDGRELRVRLSATPDDPAPAATLRLAADATAASDDGGAIPLEELRRDDLIAFQAARPPRAGDVIEVRAITLIARPPAPPGR